MRATTIIRLAARAGMTIEVRADLVTKMLHVRRYAENFAGVNRMCLTKLVA
jgi:hypothetical protein